ncbi:hypothetical protein EYV94_14600 [Puteibacter caeruleilacunae]|nr:hypothetical protein EYV94_14600 [Puteibacter caeruleilacunae]
MTQEVREYKFPKYLKIITFIVAPLLIGGFGYLGVLPFINNYGLGAKIFLILLSLFLIFSIVMAVIEAVKTKLEIRDGKFIKTRIFSVRILQFDELEGYREDNSYTYLIPNNDKKAIKVTKYFSGTYELLGFLDSNFRDLDKWDLLKERRKLLNNKKFGRNGKEVKAKVKEAEKITKPLNWIAIATAILLFVYPVYYELLTVVNVVLPVIALVVVLKSNGLIQIISDEGSIHPTLNKCLTLPFLSLLVRALIDYNVYSYKNVWLPVIVLTGLIIYLIKEYFIEDLSKESIGVKLFAYAFVVSTIGFFMFGTLIQLNCTFDSRKYESVETVVVSKEISEGRRSTSYKLEIVDWNDKNETIDVKVSRKSYMKTNENDNVEVILKSGLFNIPWYKVSIK